MSEKCYVIAVPTEGHGSVLAWVGNSEHRINQIRAAFPTRTIIRLNTHDAEAFARREMVPVGLYSVPIRNTTEARNAIQSLLGYFVKGPDPDPGV